MVFLFIEVEENNYHILNEKGRRARVMWRVLALDRKKCDDGYYNPDTGRTYPMRKIMKNRRL